MSTILSNYNDDTRSNDIYSELENVYREALSGSEVTPIEEARVVPRSVSIPNSAASSASSYIREDIRQRWSGVVLENNDEVLKAKIVDLSNPKNPDEIVDIEIEEIDFKDRLLIKHGAPFIWQIGYRMGSKISRENFSTIRFRRLPKWSEHEVVEAEKTAKEYIDFFNFTEE